MPRSLALSIVAPHGRNIALGRKTIEVRSWRPPRLPLSDLLVVENDVFLLEDGQTDPGGWAVALVDVVLVEPWQPAHLTAACATRWEPGYHAWHLQTVRPFACPRPVLAARKLYEVEFDDQPDPDDQPAIRSVRQPGTPE